MCAFGIRPTGPRGMSTTKIVPVAESEGVTIYCQTDGVFSFFNSPYIAHRTYSGVDIYMPKEFGEIISSPVLGRVSEIRRVRCPDRREFEASKFDYVTLIRSVENPKRMVKILHVKPTVEPGRFVEPGQELGLLLRSGYFDFWTDPHVHVEVRDPQDPIRARGGFKIKRTLLLNDIESLDTEPPRELRGTVVKVRREYSLIVLKNSCKYGLPVDVNGSRGILDGGVPHYGWFGIHTSHEPSLGGVVKLCGAPIGVLKSVFGKTGLAECSGFRLLLGGVKVGFSLYLYPSGRPLVKVVPPKPGALNLELSEEVRVAVVTS